jgi:hypothetical protein
MATKFIAFGAQGRNRGQDTAFQLQDAADVVYEIEADSDTNTLRVTRDGSPIGGFAAGVTAKTANYTLTVADGGKFFTTEGAGGAVTFTLPATASLPTGWTAEFFQAADQDMIIAAGTADTMVTFNDLAADSIAFSTTAEQIGNYVKIVKGVSLVYAIVGLGAETSTPTIAT